MSQKFYILFLSVLLTTFSCVKADNEWATAEEMGFDKWHFYSVGYFATDFTTKNNFITTSESDGVKFGVLQQNIDYIVLEKARLINGIQRFTIKVNSDNLYLTNPGRADHFAVFTGDNSHEYAFLKSNNYKYGFYIVDATSIETGDFVFVNSRESKLTFTFEIDGKLEFVWAIID